MTDCIFAFLIDAGTILSGFSTLAIAILTFFLWRENKLLRLIGSEPQIGAFFEMHQDGTGGVNIAISNYGSGLAFDVSFSFQADKDDFKKYGVIVDHNKKRPPLGALKPGGSISFLFGIGYQLFGAQNGGAGEPLKPFGIQVSWKDKPDGKVSQRTYILDISQFSGLPGMMNRPYALLTALELEKMNKQLSALTQQLSPLVAFVDATKPEQNLRQKVKSNPYPEDIGSRELLHNPPIGDNLFQAGT